MEEHPLSTGEGAAGQTGNRAGVLTSLFTSQTLTNQSPEPENSAGPTQGGRGAPEVLKLCPARLHQAWRSSKEGSRK